MKFLRSFTISRPMLFLCGPAIPSDKTARKRDRRVILSKAILKKGSPKGFKPLPFIVDELFNDNPPGDITKYELNIGLLEEIVANLSYRTYIFLDTMSTSYELGLFSNSKQRNNVVMLLDNEYKDRNNCSVGAYIEKATKSNVSTFIQYSGRYNGKGHLFFEDNKLPLNIKKDVVDCLEKFKQNNTYNLSFTKGFDKKQSIGNIQYEFNRNTNKLIFKLDFKTLFYLLCANYSPNNYDIYDKNVDSQIIDLKSTLVSSFIGLLIDKQIISELYFHNLDIDFFDYNYQIPEIISNMKFIIYRMKTKKVTYMPSSIMLPTTPDDFSYAVSTFIFDGIDSKDFFGINDKDYTDLCDYKEHPSKYVREFPLEFKKKIRTIQTYKNNRCGKTLRKIHEKIFEQLRCYLPTSRDSFAYKQGNSIKQCLERHLNSNFFLKLDIHDYFHSISKKELGKDILLLQKDLISKFIEKYRLSTYWPIFRYDKRVLYSILDGLMWNHSVPIGFVTSPILSDYYLFDRFDKKMATGNLIYTRYADDILISSLEPFSFGKEKLFITHLLKSKGLALNENKTKSFSLREIGDSIKFLGLVLTKTDEGNDIKISKSYLIKVSQLIEKRFKGYKTKTEWLEKINGMVNYIKSISESSYQQLIKIYRLHHTDSSSDYFKLKSCRRPL